MFHEQKQNTAAWSNAWTRYNSHVRTSCSNLGTVPRTERLIKLGWSVKPCKGTSCKTLKIEDLIISPNTEMTEIYKWFNIQVDPEATGISIKVWLDLYIIFSIGAVWSDKKYWKSYATNNKTNTCTKSIKFTNPGKISHTGSCPEVHDVFRELKVVNLMSVWISFSVISVKLFS